MRADRREHLHRWPTLKVNLNSKCQEALRLWMLLTKTQKASYGRSFDTLMSDTIPQKPNTEISLNVSRLCGNYEHNSA